MSAGIRNPLNILALPLAALGENPLFIQTRFCHLGSLRCFLISKDPASLFSAMSRERAAWLTVQPFSPCFVSCTIKFCSQIASCYWGTCGSLSVLPLVNQINNTIFANNPWGLPLTVKLSNSTVFQGTLWWLFLINTQTNSNYSSSIL